MRIPTGFHLDRHVAETAKTAETAFVGRGRERMIGHNGNDGGAMTGTDLPQMEVGDSIALTGLVETVEL